MNEIACPFCEVRLPTAALAEGWCENCGKKLPPAIQSAAAVAGIRPANSHPSTAEGGLSGSQGRTTVTLRGGEERVTRSLPPLCMCCGSDATNTKQQKFVWVPLWVIFPAALHVVPRREMTVRMPLCDRHRHPWFWQYLVGTFLLGYALMLPWFLIAFTSKADQMLGPGNTGSMAIIGVWFVCLLILFCLTLVLRRRSIFLKSIVEDEITLGGVSDVFAERLQHREKLFGR